mmetsp:Transcript_26421/g.53852  ORF Transcript_26421/g.53852 Transcript_26421/m.53852 type:complete len:232 (-) Transcript_26421:305-1000(-)
MALWCSRRTMEVVTCSQATRTASTSQRIRHDSYQRITSLRESGATIERTRRWRIVGSVAAHRARNSRQRTHASGYCVFSTTANVKALTKRSARASRHESLSASSVRMRSKRTLISSSEACSTLSQASCMTSCDCFASFQHWCTSTSFIRTGFTSSVSALAMNDLCRSMKLHAPSSSPTTCSCVGGSTTSPPSATASLSSRVEHASAATSSSMWWKTGEASESPILARKRWC